MIVIADASKVVPAVGAFALPIEVNLFGLEATRRSILAVARAMSLPEAVTQRRHADGSAYLTDGGHTILDAAFGRIEDPNSLADALVAIPGVVEHGLFIGLADLALIAGADGVASLTRSSL
jgi:ribose 5-phosphate isomerase A